MKTVSILFACSLITAFVSIAPAQTQDAAAKKQAATVSFFEQVSAKHSGWDADHDGSLSTKELDAAVADKRVTGKTAAAAVALKRASRSTKIKCPPLTLANIYSYATNSPATNKVDFVGMYQDASSRINNSTNRELFATGAPRLDTIHQGRLGNCFTLAPLGAMVHRDPKQVAGLFTRRDDGSYNVRFGSRTVTVAPPTDAELAMTSSNESDGIWVNLYEKAVGVSRLADKAPGLQQGSPIDDIARGGSAGTMLAYITGNEMTRFSFKFAKDETVTAAEREAKLKDLREQLTVAAKKKILMTCGTIKPTTPGVTPNHAYAVLDYNPKTDAVKLWNPYGNDFTPKGEPGLKNGYARKGGIFEIPTADFVQQFSGMAFEVNPRVD